MSKLLEVALCFDHSIITENDTMGRFQSFLIEHLRSWSCKLRLYRDDDVSYPINTAEANGLAEALSTCSAKRGPVFHALVREYGGDTRTFGSAEFRGSDESLILVIKFDEQRFSASAGRWLWSNKMTFQLKDFVLGSSGDVVQSCRDLFKRAVSELKPTYARAHSQDEYEAKNVRRDKGYMAIGMDISKYLPGLYWGNYFGKTYTEFMALKRLSLDDVCSFEDTADGAFIFLGPDPFEWSSASYLEKQEHTIERIGRQYFFIRDAENADTLAPDYGLPILRKMPRFS